MLISVRVDEPGEVTVPDLGLFAPGSPELEAKFDIFADRPGLYSVIFTPLGGSPRRIGSLLVAADR